MNKKLTLNIDQEVIEKAKLYAKSNEVSLSKLIESYLSALIERKEDEIKITPLVKSLSGVINIEKNLDVKSDYTDYLVEKFK